MTRPSHGGSRTNRSSMSLGCVRRLLAYFATHQKSTVVEANGFNVFFRKCTATIFFTPSRSRCYLLFHVIHLSKLFVTIRAACRSVCLDNEAWLYGKIVLPRLFLLAIYPGWIFGLPACCAFNRFVSFVLLYYRPFFSTTGRCLTLVCHVCPLS